MRTRINCIQRHNDSGEMSCGNLLMFSHVRRPLSKNTVSKRYLIDFKFRQLHNYKLFNYDELMPFV